MQGKREAYVVGAILGQAASKSLLLFFAAERRG